ncbi:conserved hypothetical protein [Flavobacterium sp. 9AF]|uniref:glycosyltransferase n=1 Tax=Flavobacterium sp. 9AF TaxID=2653142 RepID=UPI0012F27231|nr:glycosyltransferase [Flavobacterium sp. 9AF]VXC30624.1 conserved hypothetical protein [Flavobacterium sp. 9AF]
MDKKKILFIVSNMESGGVSKSMTSLLNAMDTTQYEVDIFITNPSGVFMELIPSDINKIVDKRTQLLLSSFPKNLVKLLKDGFILSFFIRMIVASCMVFNKAYGAWILSRFIYKINKEYDLAVDYNGQHQLYYLVDFIKAKKKVSFFHSDYSQWNYYYAMDKKYYSKIDEIFTISEICVTALKKYFPNEKHKIGLFENISSPILIEKLAHQLQPDMVANSILSVGHLSLAKGTALALEVAFILKNRKVDFKWYFIGADSKDKDYLKLVEEYNIQENIVFLGVLVNPYPYIKAAKMIAHLSYFEGKSIALDEAKIMKKPVVVTQFSTVSDQFKEDFNASICDFNAVKIADSIEELFNNKELCNKYSSNLNLESIDNSSEIKKLYKLID